MNMKDRLEQGILVLKALDPSSIEAGTMGLLYMDNKAEIVTYEHMTTDGAWYVIGKTFSKTIENHTGYKIHALCTERDYPVEFKSWKTIINNNLLDVNDRSLHQFIITPYKFKEGKSVQTCTECLSSFIAARSQPYCKRCCEDMATAKLKRDAVQKPKRPRIKSSEQTKQLLLEAYRMGQSDYPVEDFNEWLITKLK